MVVSCDKHEIMYDTDPITPNDAEFQLHYFEPITDASANYIDSVFVNGKLYSSINGSGQLATYNGVPGGGIGRFFAVDAGNVHFEFYRGGIYLKSKVEKDNKGNFKDSLDKDGNKILLEPIKVYDQTVNLTPGKQNVIVHNLNAAPVVISNQYPYWNNTVSNATAATFDTDSCAKVMFINLLYEAPGQPYQGKIQYKYSTTGSGAPDEEWHNLGAPVGFGEATERVKITVRKTVHNSSGYQRVDYRMYDEAGKRLVVGGSNYSDYWTAYIGRCYMHFFGGLRVGSPKASVKQWTSK